MGLHLKTTEAQRLARELAELTGQSMTTAATDAMRHRLEELKRDKEKSARLKKIMDIARDIRSRMSEEARTMNIDEYLYDENGLPK